ncbi:hypothetical protein Tco_0799629 [Tanacetum coccineum]|uniref:Uncharacterized protein n=1 Tax=Tanacetum coccineum TaxID=301880 RepID=A0ABQ4ZTP9_9ASTR
MHKLNIYSITRVLFILPRYGINSLSKFSPDTELVLYPLQYKLTSRDKSLDLSAFKLSRLFFSLLSLGLSSCWRSYGVQLRLRILKNDNAHEHVERVLDFVSLFNILGVSHDAVMLCVFPITLTGAAKRQVDRLPLGTVDAWDLLKKPLSRGLPVNEEVKSVKEAKYGEFRRSGAKYHVGPLGYFTRIDNRPSFEEKRPSLEELMNKHLEESTRRRAKMEE